MMSRTRRILFGALAVLLAALFVRLGFWQLDRRAERLERNALRERRAALPAIELSGPPLPALDSVAWRRIRLRGRYDTAREVVLRGRARESVPGVEVLTPLRLHGDAPSTSGAAAAGTVLVLRGWLPAADGLRADLGGARPPDAAAESAAVVAEGIAVPMSPRSAARPILIPYAGREHLVLASPEVEAVRAALSYPVAEFYVLASDPGLTGPALHPPVRREAGAGPHLSYAVQWFSFAAIALVGTTLYLRKDRRA